MKKIFHFSCLWIMFGIVFTNQSSSQFVMTSAYNPVLGDSTVSRTVDTSGITEGEAGANKVWNFQNITIYGNPSIEYYVSPSSTPYYNQFPNSNLASYHVSGSYTAPHYQIVSDTAYATAGWVDPGNPVSVAKFIIPFVINHYPVYYSSQYTGNYYCTITSGNIIEYKRGTKTEVCDGYGTIILPWGTYYNTLRIKTVDDEIDTVKVGGVVTSIYHNVSENYFWYVQELKFPVFVISHGTFYNEYSKNISCYTVNEPIGVKQILSSVPGKYFLYQNYPNPFNPVTKIKFDVPAPNLIPGGAEGSTAEEHHIRLVIYDALGREVSTLINGALKPGVYEVSWDAGSHAGGIYFCRMEAGDYVSARKMILVK